MSKKRTPVAEKQKAPAAEVKKHTGPRVYCGPSIKAIARQYTVFTGDVPEALAQFIQKNPAAGSLLVPVERFAETRRRLETAGTAESILYKKIKSKL